MPAPVADSECYKHTALLRRLDKVTIPCGSTSCISYYRKWIPARTSKAVNEGSNPSWETISVLVAQLVERGSEKPEVARSIRAGNAS